MHCCFPDKLPNYLITEAPSTPQLNLPFKAGTMVKSTCNYNPTIIHVEIKLSIFIAEILVVEYHIFCENIVAHTVQPKRNARAI